MANNKRRGEPMGDLRDEEIELVGQKSIRPAATVIACVAAGFALGVTLSALIAAIFLTRLPATTEGVANPSTPVAILTDNQVAINGQGMLNEYFDNPFTAGQKYDGKKVRLTVTILQIKMVNGRMQLWNCALPNGTLPLIVFDTKPEPGPGAKTIKAFEMATIEGICRGRMDDGRFRVPAPGWTFQINVTDCTVLKSGKDLPILNP